MVSQKYRWDFIGLSTDEKPTSETSDKVVNGSTYYCSDTSKLYVYCDGTWYERKPLGGGGGGGTSDFNDLSNRPKYNGSDMTGSTNIPEVKSYTAGTNVSISDQNVISATDTTYSAFTGTDGTAAGAAGLVPAPATTDAGKFLKADGTWDTAGGGSGPTVVQTTGNSTSDVMSQNAVTSMVYADPSTAVRIRIGNTNTSANNTVTIGTGTNGVSSQICDNAVAIGWNAVCGASTAVAIGSQSKADFAGGMAIGRGARSNTEASVALGAYSSTSEVGEVNIGSTAANWGYHHNSNYRLLTGLYDGQSDHDAATVGQIKMGVLSATPTGTTVGFPGRLYTYDSGGGTYEVYLCVHDNGDSTYVWKQVSLI